MAPVERAEQGELLTYLLGIVGGMQIAGLAIDNIQKNDIPAVCESQLKSCLACGKTITLFNEQGGRDIDAMFRNMIAVSQCSKELSDLKECVSHYINLYYIAAIGGVAIVAFSFYKMYAIAQE